MLAVQWAEEERKAIEGTESHMAFNIDGTTIRCSDGSEGTIKQMEFYRDKERDAWFVDLEVRCQETSVRGKLRYTSEAYDERFPGKSDLEKSNAVATRLAQWMSENTVRDGFFLRIDGNVMTFRSSSRRKAAREGPRDRQGEAG